MGCGASSGAKTAPEPDPDPNPEDDQDRIDLRDRNALAKFLEDADIRLVRAEYLFQLRHSRTPLPRRQEAESETCVINGQESSALVAHEEVREWAARSRDAIICSVSHSWEAREHPDPCCYQLEQIVNCAALYDLAYFSHVWLFYDYVSLFQFPRQTGAQEESFRRSMANMHVLYAHECSLTFRLSSLTPEALWKSVWDDAEYQVPVYHVPSGAVKALPLRDLVANRARYEDRGWCRSEVEWSSARYNSQQHQQIDPLESGVKFFDVLGRGKVPMAPDMFRQRMAGAKFTHRADEESVIRLQAKIFHEKVTSCEEVRLADLPCAEFATFVKALQHYRHLKTLRLHGFHANAADAKAFGEAVASNSILTSLEIGEIRISMHTAPEAVIKAIARGLQSSTSITTFVLEATDITNAAAQALAGALKRNSSITSLRMADNRVEPAGAQALAQGLQANRSIAKVDLSYNYGGGDVGAQALAEALKCNSSITSVTLGNSDIGFLGAEALAEALQVNSSITSFDNFTLDHLFQRIPDEAPRPVQRILEAVERNRARVGGAAEASDAPCAAWEPAPAEALGRPRFEDLAETLKTNSACIELYLAATCTCMEDFQAVAEALKRSSSVTSVNLFENAMGDAAAQVLADGLKANKSVQFLYLGHNSIGDLGAQALAAALTSSRPGRISIHFQGNCVGDAGAQAFLEAGRVSGNEIFVHFHGNCVSFSVTDQGTVTIIS